MVKEDVRSPTSRANAHTSASGLLIKLDAHSLRIKHREQPPRDLPPAIAPDPLHLETDPPVIDILVNETVPVHPRRPRLVDSQLDHPARAEVERAVHEINVFGVPRPCLPLHLARRHAALDESALQNVPLDAKGDRVGIISAFVRATPVQRTGIVEVKGHAEPSVVIPRHTSVTRKQSTPVTALAAFLANQRPVRSQVHKLERNAKDAPQLEMFAARFEKRVEPYLKPAFDESGRDDVRIVEERDAN